MSLGLMLLLLLLLLRMLRQMYWSILRQHGFKWILFVVFDRFSIPHLLLLL